MMGSVVSGSAMQSEHFPDESQAIDGAASPHLPPWADGWFTGTIYRGDDAAGTASGFLKLGRNSHRGWFNGTWGLGEKQGQVGGFFFGRLVVGHLTVAGSVRFAPLVAVLEGNASWFSARPVSLPGRNLRVSGARRASFLPEPSGPYQIGTTTVHLVDREREELFTDDPSDSREILLQIWYPAANGSRGKGAPYMDPETFDWLKRESPIPLFWIPDNAYASVLPHAIRDPPPPAGKTFPVLLFSHGYDGVREIYTSLVEDLVSHGYVVAAIQHPYVAGVTVFPDGRVVEHREPPGDPDEAETYFKMAFDSVIGDMGFALDVLSRMESSLRSCLDLERIGIYGHSFGGGASAAVCNRDGRVMAGAALDGFFRGEAVENGTESPFLHLLADGHFKRDATLRQLWNRTTRDAYMASVAGAAHYSYTDVGLLLMHLSPLLPRRAVGFGAIEPKRLIAITNAYTLTFFDVYLKEKPLDGLLRLAEQYPEVSFRYK